jgi:hypothetical protein
MDWNSLIPLAGVILGSGITYLVQSGILKKQREWELDNQKREWKRSRLNSILQQYIEIANESTFFLTLAKTKSLEEFQTSIIQRMSRIDFWEDEELSSLQESYADLLMSLIFFYSNNLDKEIEIMPQLAQQVNKLSSTFVGIKSRINQLLENTYD